MLSIILKCVAVFCVNEQLQATHVLLLLFAVELITASVLFAWRLRPQRSKEQHTLNVRKLLQMTLNDCSG